MSDVDVDYDVDDDDDDDDDDDKSNGWVHRSIFICLLPCTPSSSCHVQE